MADPAYLYDLFGLMVASDMPLPELIPAEVRREADVCVTIGTIASSERTAGLFVNGQDALLIVPDVGRFLAIGGDTLVVEPAPQVSGRNLRLYLLGSAFAAIIHQRGLLPLHANAVVMEGRAIGFMGHPGAGKSTLAAWFHDHGFELLTDDVCVVDRREGAAVAYPGIPRLRLWREALEASGREATHYDRSFDDLDKFTVPIDRENAPQPRPLSHLYLLDKANQSREPFISRITGAAAVEALVGNTYRGGYVPIMNRTREHLQACIQLARTVPVFVAHRRWGYESFDAQCAVLAEHARETLGNGDHIEVIG